MHVQYVALCDTVILGNDGRPSLIGVFNDLQVPNIPFTLPRLAFAARILFTHEEVGRSHKVEVLMSDPSGKEIGRPGGEVTLPPMPSGLDSVSVDLPLVFDLFNIATAGRYTFLLHVDGAPTAAVQLNIRQAVNA
ncbi:MAG TPA: hypothetical protein VJN70_09865 [Gemmatimonadaceae bacterium]|nr:hypothetical protein [Gemmatimonadaceae bacterium]